MLTFGSQGTGTYRSGASVAGLEPLTQASLQELPCGFLLSEKFISGQPAWVCSCLDVGDAGAESSLPRMIYFSRAGEMMSILPIDMKAAIVCLPSPGSRR